MGIFFKILNLRNSGSSLRELFDNEKGIKFRHYAVDLKQKLY